MNTLTFNVYRVEGVDVYGSFLIGITLKDSKGKVLIEKDGEELAQFPTTNINNDYVAKVTPGKHSLIIHLRNEKVHPLYIASNCTQNTHFW